MAKVPFWGDAPLLWQQVKIAGVDLPGIATVKGKITRKVDNQEIPGSDGATVTQLGYEAAEVSIKLVMFTPAHLERFQKLVPTLRPRKGEKNPPPVTVVHPALELLQIRSLHVMEIGIPTPGDVKDTYEVELEMTEFIPETKRPNRTGQAGAGSTTSSVNLAQEFSAKPTAATAVPPSRGGMTLAP